MEFNELTFIKIGYKAKTPMEKWSQHQYRYTRSQMNEQYKNGYMGNVGVVTGINGLVVLDLDDVNTCQETGLVPEMDTLTIKTGSGGLHFYYHTDRLSPEKVIFYLKDGDDFKHLGELQALGQYVVGAQSIHPNGNEYTVISETETIKDCSYKSITEPFFDVGCISTVGLIGHGAKTNMHYTQSKSHVTPFRIEDVWDLSGFKKIAPGVYQGPHPVHGSTHGANLCVDTNLQLWRCWRCCSGGDALNALAVDAGLISCHESVRGCLRGSVYGEVGIEALNRGLIK